MPEQNQSYVCHNNCGTILEVAEQEFDMGEDKPTLTMLVVWCSECETMVANGEADCGEDACYLVRAQR